MEPEHLRPVLGLVHVAADETPAAGIDQVCLVTAGLSLLACLCAFAVIRGAAGAASAG